MALVNCPECDSSISDQATSCPKCGFPLQGNRLGNGGDDEASSAYESPTKSRITGSKFRSVIIFLATFGPWIGIVGLGLPTSCQGFGIGMQQAKTGMEYHHVKRFYASEGAIIKVVDGELELLRGKVIQSRPAVRHIETLTTLFLLAALWVVGSAYKRDRRSDNTDL